jgi:hypothetical protein
MFPKLLTAVLALVLSGAATPSPAKPTKRIGLSVYSTLCSEKQSGDAAGHRIKLIRLGDGDELIYEWSEGGLSAERAHDIKIDPKTGALKFQVTTDAGGGEETSRFEGKITDDAIVGTLRSAHALNEGLNLPRQRNLAAKTADCP